LGPKVKAFEEHFAAYVGVSHGVGVASGSDAVQLALRACGVGPGDEVVTVSHTAGATVSAINWIGARAILVDIEPDTFNIQPEAVEATLQRAANQRIKAIVAVHLYGHPAAMDELRGIAARHGVALIEDCAQAHGANIGARMVGSIGECGAFSFYPTKNLGAFGDGGAVVTGNDATAQALRLLQQYGWRERYISETLGYNSRLDELQAAILDCKLGLLNAGNDRRRQIARRYSEGLAGLPLTTPVERSGCRHVYHQYVVRLANRDALRAHLESHGIKSSILYPKPIHQQPGYREHVGLGVGGLRETERVCNELLCLPIYPELPDTAVESVIACIRSYFQ
jgi:dTDP-4-amino-4,6-dideoxygalactose transaminase